MLLLAAQRLAETASMEWTEVDFAVKVWTIPKEKAKSGRAHEVQLCEQTLSLLRSLPRFGPYVFTGKTGRSVTGFTWCKDQLDGAMAEVTGGAAIEPFILHDLRRTAATHMARLGVAPHVVDRILNHSSGTVRGVAAIYNRFEYQDERRAALAAWSLCVRNLITPNVVALERKS